MDLNYLMNGGDIIDTSCTCFEDQHILPSGKRTFCPETYIGNWYEDTVRNTLKREEFFNDRDCEQLTIQKSQKMVDLLLKPVQLSRRINDLLHYGDTIQLMFPGIDCPTAHKEAPFFKNPCKLNHLVVSASVPPESIDHAPYMSTDSIISASGLLYPCVRNTFVVERPDCPEDTTSVVKYGDPFRLRALPTQHFDLYLFSAPAGRLHFASTYSARPKVRLSDVKTQDTLWRAMPLCKSDEIRMALGIPVPLKTKLIIKHAISGNNLSIEPKFPVLTYFGEDYEVTVETKRNQLRQISYENFWYFDTERKSTKCDAELEQKDFEEQAKFSAAINADEINKSAAETGKREEAAQRAREERRREIDEEDRECYRQQGSTSGTNPNFSTQSQVGLSVDSASCLLKDLHLRGEQLPYDPRTAPQPHAHDYQMTNTTKGFPNQKYNCGDTNCCHIVDPMAGVEPPCEKPKCYEMGPYLSHEVPAHNTSNLLR